MNNQDIKVELNEGGYYSPIKILENDEAINLNNYYHDIKNKNCKKNLILEHKFKAHLLFKEIIYLIKNN